MSGINPNTKSVTVEWYEKGEAKGKEVSTVLTDLVLCFNIAVNSVCS